MGERAADQRIETLQDRIHRLYAWSLLDKTAFASKIKRETGALISLQNRRRRLARARLRARARARSTRPGSSPGRCFESVCRATTRRSRRPGDYLLSQQQDFGGWFQTTTHENFRTPMRETRYAVMALAEAFPRPGAPLHGWGNRDAGPARLPRTDSLVNTLDDLENLWDVPEPDRARFAQAIAPLLEHPQPLVRATAAPRWADWGRPNQPRRWPGGLPTPARSSGARLPGPCEGSGTTEWASR